MTASRVEYGTHFKSNHSEISIKGTSLGKGGVPFKIGVQRYKDYKSVNYAGINVCVS